MKTALHIVLPFFAGCIASYLAVGRLRLWAVRMGIFAVPNARSSHRYPVPVGGGIVFVVITLSAIVVYPTFIGHPEWRRILAFCGAAIIVAGVSWIDDLRHVRFGVRLLCHAEAGVILVAGYSAWHTITLPLLGPVNLGPLGAIVTVLWIAGLVNAFNFVDGLDGLAAAQALIAGAGWAAIGLIDGLPIITTLGVFLAAGSVGFLGHNWHPARIFMGDVGSAFLGYTFAALAVIGAAADPRLAVAGLLLVWPCVFDAGFTTLRRLSHGENIFTGHRSFLFHRLQSCGWAHARVASLYLGLAFAGAVLAVAWDVRVPSADHLVLLVVPALALALWLLVIGEELRTAARADRLPRTLFSAPAADADDLVSVEA